MRFTSMDLRGLKYFVVVAQELNITRAAEKLNMSQPPLSNQLKALEEENQRLKKENEELKKRLEERGERR